MLQYNIVLPEVRDPTQILITDTLPKDAYIDPYQLSKRIENNEFKILTDKLIHTEIPAYQAQSFRIQLCSVSQTNSHEIELPIHLRYQKPHDCKIYGKSVIINLSDAMVQIRTLNKGFSNAHCLNIENDDSWVEKMVTAKTSFHVPVGCAEDLCVVFVLTISVVVGTALYLSSMLIKLNKRL